MQPKAPSSERQAVVIIHGIGEQEPMKTLRDFAETIIPDAEKGSIWGKQKFYIKPDQLSQLFDLRRITVPQDAKKTRMKTDFYEYYWAHQIRNTQISDVISWIAKILLHRKFVPKRLKPIHSMLLLLLLLIPTAFIILVLNVPDLKQRWLALMAAGAGIFYLGFKGIGMFIKSISVNFIGDAARYLTPKPGNIINRQQIRQEGLTLLRKLHGELEPGAEKKPRYDRIVIVSHSLGAVIAYDLLSTLWSSYHDEFNQLSQEHQAKLLEMENKVKAFSEKELAEPLTVQELGEYQQLQGELLAASKAAGNPWRISDFVTIGNPLSHAQLLLAKGEEDLRQMHRERLFPTCPPTLEAQGTLSFSETYNFTSGVDTKMNVPNHGALYALTKWTNCWFKNDFVGGSMQQSFGKGITDIELTSKTHSKIPFLSHTFYWDKRETESVDIIRNIIFK